MKLIGVGGTNAAGKDSLADMLVERHGWLHVSLSNILRDELRERGQPLTRKNLRLLSAEWRRKFGLGILVDKSVDKYRSSTKRHPGLVIASLRNWGEADEVHRLIGMVVWVDAEPKLRYLRIKSRTRDGEHLLSYEEFLAEEQEEMEHYEDDKHTLNLAGVKDRADIFLENNGNDIEKFKDQAEKALAVILKS